MLGKIEKRTILKVIKHNVDACLNTIVFFLGGGGHNRLCKLVINVEHHGIRNEY